jgi:hypothetical protein
MESILECDAMLGGAGLSISKSVLKSHHSLIAYLPLHEVAECAPPPPPSLVVVSSLWPFPML